MKVYYDMDGPAHTTGELAQALAQLETQHHPAIVDACQQILNVLG